MKLLILTQKVDINDDLLGFMHDWIAEFSRHCDSVTVICLWRGEHHLPANVKVLSLGKERGRSKIKYLFNFYWLIWHERRHYDAVWVHMNPEYVVLGGLLWRLWGKKIGLWYAHGHVSFILRIAVRLAHVIFTSTASGFRLPSSRIKIIGQGIDAEKFKPPVVKSRGEKFRVITVGRISPAKDLETLVAAAEILAKENRAFQIEIIGGAGLPEQETYLAKIKGLVEEKGLGGLINFRGPLPNKDILSYLQAADLFVNMSQTGSLDKAILEAMAGGLPIVSCNQAIVDELANDPRFIFESRNTSQLAQKIARLMDLYNNQPAEFASWGRELREVVIKRHGLAAFVKKILGQF
jgi:glycosyltransferase involved in cell wall biosynthesis